MKKFIFIFFLVISSSVTSQNERLDSWIKEIVNDMIEMNDLEKYSSEELSPDLNVNFIFVESVKNISINDTIITFLINHGKGNYCTKLTFEYLEKNENYYLVFATPKTKTTFGKETQWVTPWIKKENICN